MCSNEDKKLFDQFTLSVENLSRLHQSTLYKTASFYNALYFYKKEHCIQRSTAYKAQSASVALSYIPICQTNVNTSEAGWISLSSDIFSSVNKKNCASSYISTYWRTGLTRCGYHQTPYTRGFIAMAAPDRHTHSSPPNHISHKHQTSCF